MDLYDTSLEVAIRMYRVFNQSEGKSPRTIEVHDRILGPLSDPATGLKPDTPMNAITEGVLRQFVVQRSERPLKWGGRPSPSTKNQEVRSLRAFFNWAYKEGYTDSQLLARFRPPKIPMKLIKVLTDEEIERLYAAAKESLRNTAILSIMLDTGVRASELCGIKLSDVDLEEGTVVVFGKGAKERKIAFGAVTRRHMLNYVTRERPADAICDRLLIGRYDRPLTPMALREMTHRLALKSGVDRFHPHLARHSFATRFLLNGGSSLLLKNALGHSSLKMTEIYTHLASQEAVTATRSFSPLDALRNR